MTSRSTSRCGSTPRGRHHGWLGDASAGPRAARADSFRLSNLEFRVEETTDAEDRAPDGT
jgi:hypothetical protein